MRHCWTKRRRQILDDKCDNWGEACATGAAEETTLEPHEFKHRGLILVDLPGCGTQRFPTADYVKTLNLGSYDLFIFVTHLRFFEDDKLVYLQLSKELRKPCFLVRNKFDEVVEAAIHDGSDLTESEIRSQIEAKVRENLSPAVVRKIYMVSAWRPEHYDLAELLKDISESLDGMKRDRWENDVAAWSKEALEKKKANAKAMLLYAAGASAANALNPSKNIAIQVDLEILQQFQNEVARIYGLTPEQEAYWRSLLKSPLGQATVQRIAALILRYGGQAAIARIVERIVREKLSQTVMSRIPYLIGPALAGSTGFALTYLWGLGLIDEYHTVAEEILGRLKPDSLE